MEYAKQITIQGINNVRTRFKNVTERTHIGRVLGFAHTVDEKATGDMGIIYKFGGEFLATNAKGEQFTGPVTFLPAEATELVRAKLEEVKRPVQFGFDFFLNPIEGTNNYTVETVVLAKVEASKALATLADVIGKVASATEKAEARANGKK